MIKQPKTYYDILKEHNDKINEIIREINKMKKTKKQKIKEKIKDFITISIVSILWYYIFIEFLIKLFS